jgi:Ca2+-transporting ATPase
LVYIGTFGLNDPIRDDIFETVNKIKHGKRTPMEEGKAAQVNVKLVTGDHIETAKYVALLSGIVSDTEVNQPGVCMTGEEFQ